MDSGHHRVSDQVRIDGIRMMAVGCPDESTAFLDSEAPLSHDALDFLVVHDQPLSTKLSRDLPVSIPGKLFSDLLYSISSEEVSGDLGR